MNSAWESVISRLKVKTIPDFTIDLLGGEPTLHPELKQLVDVLRSMDKCIEVSITTNLSKPVKYFKQFQVDGCSKLIITPSLHFEYCTQKTIDKIVEMAASGYRVHVPVMLHCNEKYWPMIRLAITTFIDKNVQYGLTFLESAHGYKSNYDTKFFEYFDDLLSIPTISQAIIKDATAWNASERQTGTDDLYPIITTKQKYMVTPMEIEQYNIKQFKGWRCTPTTWRITEYGKIVNACTGEPLHILGKNIRGETNCPLDKCDCNVRWNYEKYKE